MSYNYHKGGVSSNTRGRGFASRGSFRGRGGAENGSNNYNSPNYTSPPWSSTSRGRGSFAPSSSRGRPNWYNKDDSASFDTRKYSSNSPLNQSGNDRYSSRGRGDDSSYRRYSRIDGPGYSSREHAHHRSPEGSRKRLHSDRAFMQPSSSRRSHENTYSGSSEYGNRYSGFNEEKSGGGYGEDRGRGGSSVGASYRDDGRRSSGGGGFRSERSRGDDYHGHRKPDLDSSMPPPSTGSRGGYRGRLMRGSGRGGISRMLLRRQEILSRKRSDFIARKRLLGRFHDETLRKIKMQKLRRLQRAKEAKEATSDNETSDNPKEENWDDDEKVDKEKKEKKSEDVEKKKSTKKDKDKEKEKDKDKDKEKDKQEGDDGEEEAEEEDGEPPKKKKKPESESHVRHSSASRLSSIRHTRPYIKLSCPRCYERFITFKNYTMHLYSPKHAAVMRKQSLRHKQTLAKMRMAQRANQRLLDVEEEDAGTVARTNFCHICKLNYRQLKSKHALSDSHRDMKKFLMPFCRICRISYKSPMAYENHICSLEHIRREARLKELGDKKRHSSEERSQDEDDDKELNLDSFMTVDSVGIVDESGLNEDEIKTENKTSEKQREAPIGTEFVKTIQAQYCELCCMYLSRGDKEKVLSLHCRNRTHLKRYVRNRQERSLNREIEAKRVEKETEPKKKKSETVKRTEDEDIKEENTSPEKSSSPTTKRAIKTETSTKENPTTENDETIPERPDNESATGIEAEADAEDPDPLDDKLWADVDKNLGALLEDETGNKSSDEDEDSRAGGGRYDRFRLSEKERANSSAPSSEPDGIEKPSNETSENQPDEESERAAKVEDETIAKKSTSRNSSPNKEESSKNTD